jgi:hypothetical protein
LAFVAPVAIFHIRKSSYVPDSLEHLFPDCQLEYPGSVAGF